MIIKRQQAISQKLAAAILGLSMFFDVTSPLPAKAADWPLPSWFFPEVKAEIWPQLPKSLSRAPRKVVTVVATGYSSTPDQTDDTPLVAASGKQVYDGLIAANWLPFGTRVKLPELFGDKVFTIDDRMHERYGYGRIDIWFDAPKDEVREFGVKRARMEIY